MRRSQTQVTAVATVFLYWPSAVDPGTLNIESTPSKKNSRACRMIINTKLGDLLLKASTTDAVERVTIALQSFAVPLLFAVNLLPFGGRFKISCMSSFVLAAAMAPIVSKVHLKYQSWTDQTHLILANSTFVTIFISAAIEEAFKVFVAKLAAVNLSWNKHDPRSRAQGDILRALSAGLGFAAEENWVSVKLQSPPERIARVVTFYCHPTFTALGELVGSQFKSQIIRSTVAILFATIPHTMWNLMVAQSASHLVKFVVAALLYVAYDLLSSKSSVKT